MTQSLNSAPQKQKFSVAINSKMYQNLIASTLRDPARARRFSAAITSAVAVNPALQECDAGTILAGALLGESLNLSPSPQLGQYYLVPFKQKAKYDSDGNMVRPETTTATFVLGYKGYIQLALRSGQYKDLDVMVIKQGEYMGKDPETGKAKFQFIEDDDERETLPTIGYMAYFEYLNGFRKVVYWSKEKMMTHADTFSKAFSRQGYEDLMAGRVPEKDMWRYSSFWYKNFDDMAKKTLLRHIISRWGIMSIEMTTALEHDDAVNVADDGQIVTETVEAARASIPADAQELLDILAYDFKVDWYGYDYPLETKRALLKSSFYIHRHLGTKGAVEAAIQSVYPKSIVEEWFDYVEGGNPYTFRIVLDASTPAVPVNNTDLLRAVNLYKSLRSHLDGIMFRSTHCFEIRTGCGWCVYTARLCGTYPVQAREGAIYNFPVVVETEHGGEAYTMPLTGQPTAGTFPAPAVQGVIAGENVAVATAEDGQIYTSPMTGYATVGTHPAAAVQGSILDGVLMTDTASGSAGFEATPCGLEPGSLF